VIRAHRRRRALRGRAAAVSSSAARAGVRVEPEGADSMHARSKRQAREHREGADHRDSLGAPTPRPTASSSAAATWTSSSLVSDDQLRAAMRLLFRGAKLAVEACGRGGDGGALRPFAREARRKQVWDNRLRRNIDAGDVYETDYRVICEIIERSGTRGGRRGSGSRRAPCLLGEAQPVELRLEALVVGGRTRARRPARARPACCSISAR